MTALDDLATKARAASPGPWHAPMDKPEREPRFIDASETVRIAQAARTRDAAYIAAASPGVVLALVAVARSLTATFTPEEWRQMNERTRPNLDVDLHVTGPEWIAVCHALADLDAALEAL